LRLISSNVERSKGYASNLAPFDLLFLEFLTLALTDPAIDSRIAGGGENALLSG